MIRYALCGSLFLKASRPIYRWALRILWSFCFRIRPVTEAQFSNAVPLYGSNRVQNTSFAGLPKDRLRYFGSILSECASQPGTGHKFSLSPTPPSPPSRPNQPSLPYRDNSANSAKSAISGQCYIENLIGHEILVTVDRLRCAESRRSPPVKQ